MSRKFDHLEFTCIPYGFNVAANGRAIKDLLEAIDRHVLVCPYCLGEKVPASPFGVPPDGGQDVG